MTLTSMATGTTHSSLGTYLPRQLQAPSTVATGNLPAWPQAPTRAASRTYHGSHGEEVGVVATLLQVHHDVEQRHLVPAPLGVERLKVPREDELVVLPATGEVVQPPGAAAASERPLSALQGGRGLRAMHHLQREQGEPREGELQA